MRESTAVIQLLAGLATLVLVTAFSLPVVAATYTATLEAETQSLDLEAEIVEPREPMGPESYTADLYLAYNADRTNPFVVFQNQSTETVVAFLDGVSFDYVDLAMLEDATFTAELVDQAFDPNDTVVLVTPLDNIYKVGNAVDNGDGTVTFDVSDFE